MTKQFHFHFGGAANLGSLNSFFAAAKSSDAGNSSERADNGDANVNAPIKAIVNEIGIEEFTGLYLQNIMELVGSECETEACSKMT